MEEHSNTQRTPYLFTGKELDEETGLYCSGARYYDPRTSGGNNAVLTMLDEGPGFPEEQIGQVFKTLQSSTGRLWIPREGD